MTDQERLAIFDKFFEEEANHKFWNYINEFNQLSIEFVEYFIEKLINYHLLYLLLLL